MTDKGMNTETVDGIYYERASYAELKAAGPGAFTYTYDGGVDHDHGMDAGAIESRGMERGNIVGMIHVLPGAGFGHLNIRPHYKGEGASWDWDGNLEKPTLTPSIHAVMQPSHETYEGRIGWHGFLRAGRFESC